MLVTIAALFLLFKQSEQQQQLPDVCDAWKNSENAYYSYVVQIKVSKGYYYCSGILVEKNWVLTSYSCFKRITKQFGVNCFVIDELEDTKILIKTTVDNCVSGITDIEQGSFTKPLFGIINNNYEVENIRYLGNNIDVHINDFLLLKLRDSFEDVPLDRVKLSPFEYNSTIMYEILLEVQYSTNYFTIMGQTEVFSEIQNNNFRCSSSFTDLVCSKNRRLCKKQNFVCGKFRIPDTAVAQIHSGDPLVRKQDSFDAEIFGFLSLNFLPMYYRDYFDSISNSVYYHKAGEYSFDQNGAIFVGFTPKILNWINGTINTYMQDDCTVEEVQKNQKNVEEVQKNQQNGQSTTTLIIALSASFVVIFIVIVVIIIRNQNVCHPRDVPQPSPVSTVSFLPPHLDQSLQFPQLTDQGRITNHSGLSGSDLQALNNNSYPIPQMVSPNLLETLEVVDKLRVKELHIREDLEAQQLIGQGAFGEVYKAKVTRRATTAFIEDEFVAVKMLSKEYKTKEDLEKLLQEVAVMNQLNSEFTFVSGGSLKDLLKSKDYSYGGPKSTLLWKLNVFICMAKGIEYLHDKNIIHRDLKPANLLVEDASVPKIVLTDFGLAKIQNDEEAFSATGVMGTPNYMAPEQFNRAPDKCSDVWALGCIMQEVLVGKVPWEKLGMLQICGRYSQNPCRPDIAEQPANCPQELQEVISSCWEAEAQRPTASQLVTRLNNIKVQNQ